MKTLHIAPAALLLAVSTAACGPSTAPSKSKTPREKKLVDAEVGFIETSGSARYEPSGKKVPMPEVEAILDYDFPEVNKERFQNGLRFFHVKHSRLPLVTVDIVFRAGSAYDPGNLAGLAVFTGEMLKGGTGSRSSKQMAEELGSLGTSLEIWTDRDTTLITTTCLEEHFEAIVEILSDIVLDPTFPEDEIEILRSRELGRLTLAESDPQWLARREFAMQVYGSHPYGRYDATQGSLRNITAADIEKLHSRAYCGANGFIVVVGDVSFERAASAAGKYFNRLKRGKKLKMKKAAPPEVQERRIVIVDRPGSVQTVFKIGSTAVRRSDGDFIPLVVADNILGGSASSRLFLNVREKESLAYSIGSRVTRSVDTGTWYIAGSTSTDTTDEALASIFREVEKLGAEEVGEETLADAKSYLKGSFALRLETTEQIAGHVGDMEVYGLPDGYWGGYLDSVENVTAKEIKKLTERYLALDGLLVVLVGDAGALKELLAQHENITVK